MPAPAPSPREAGKAAFQRGDFTAAVECYTAALRHEPGSDVLNRSLAHLEAGAPEEALRDALTATTLRPENVKGWYRKGAALQALGRTRAAVVALEQAAAVAPGDEQVQARLAQARAAAAAEREGRAAEAAPPQRKELPQPKPSAQAPPPQQPPPQQQQPPHQQSAESSSAVLRSMLGIGQPGGGAGGAGPTKRGAAKHRSKAALPPAPKPQKRVMWADEVEEIDAPPVPEAAAPPAAAADAAGVGAAFAARAAAAFRAADFAAALSFYTEALSERPNDAQLLCNRSAAAHGLGLFDAAHVDAVAAAEAAPERAKCHMRAGTAAAALRRWPEAAAAYQRALALNPAADDARQRLAMVQAAMMAEEASLQSAGSDDPPSCGEEAPGVGTPPGASPEPSRASDSEDGASVCGCGPGEAAGGAAAEAPRGVSVPMPPPAAGAEDDAVTLAAALATAARCSDSLAARAAALAARVAQLEAELAAARAARCAHCGRCSLAPS